LDDAVFVPSFNLWTVSLRGGRWQQNVPIWLMIQPVAEGG
jgi:hypothetical protein